jgi:hypothetical protein
MATEQCQCRGPVHMTLYPCSLYSLKLNLCHTVLCAVCCWWDTGLWFTAVSQRLV